MHTTIATPKNNQEHAGEGHSVIQLIEDAFFNTYTRCPWGFQNEAEFKHELFFRLGEETIDGVPLADAAPGAPTPRLHAESKVENGNPAKADLILCDPSRTQSFNYVAEHVIELKHSLTNQGLATELEKLDSYKRVYDSVYIASAQQASRHLNSHGITHGRARRLRVIGPPAAECVAIQPADASDGIIEAVYHTAIESIERSLWRYGKGRRQYQSSLWCNYEHEIERGHSFPCEGDFNAQLYRDLRKNLPGMSRIFSEYTPANLSRRRIDFVIADTSNKWAIPIEVKMNWDQFKPKYKKRVVQASEASTILSRFEALGSEYREVRPILVVIQGHWRRQTKMQIRRKALAELATARLPLELLMFNENSDGVERKHF